MIPTAAAGRSDLGNSLDLGHSLNLDQQIARRTWATSTVERAGQLAGYGCSPSAPKYECVHLIHSGEIVEVFEKNWSS